MTTLATVLLLVLALPACLSAIYLAALTLLSAAAAPLPRSSRSLRFDIVVPAHNEAAGIQRTIASLQRLDWPRDRFRVIVVADNCDDATGPLARAAEAAVLTRTDAGKRGKGYALSFAFQDCLAREFADAVAVVDADTEVSENLLEAFAARIERGAQAVQAHHGILNPQASWRTRLLTIAKAAFHVVRSRARERLQLSTGIRGNGWCVTAELLRSVPYRAYSLTEDIEYGITLGLVGVRVHYADEADANSDMAVDGTIAATQRQRWEDGRLQLIRSRTGPLLAAALLLPSRICLDLAFDLLLQPLSWVALNIVALILAAGALSYRLPLWPGWLWLGGSCGLVLLLHVLRGWQISRLGAQGLADLARAPFFVLWKLLVMMRRRDPRGWVSTRREGL